MLTTLLIVLLNFERELMIIATNSISKTFSQITASTSHEFRTRGLLIGYNLFRGPFGLKALWINSIADFENL